MEIIESWKVRGKLLRVSGKIDENFEETKWTGNPITDYIGRMILLVDYNFFGFSKCWINFEVRKFYFTLIEIEIVYLLFCCFVGCLFYVLFENVLL